MIRRPPRSTLFPTRRSSDLFGECAQRRRHEWTYGRKNNRGIDSFRRHLIGTASPNRANFFSGLLCCFVAGAKENKEFPPFVNANFADQMGEVTKNKISKAR